MPPIFPCLWAAVNQRRASIPATGTPHLFTIFNHKQKQSQTSLWFIKSRPRGHRSSIMTRRGVLFVMDSESTSVIFLFFFFQHLWLVICSSQSFIDWGKIESHTNFLGSEWALWLVVHWAAAPGAAVQSKSLGGAGPLTHLPRLVSQPFKFLSASYASRVTSLFWM